ncbi:DUF6274 family protein [Streptomyces sp. HUAS MG47]|uniref:DUF6274 family protein n=1 Tax=Streptomyces solicamelliae TaxID=3231716 RepID=UPI003877EE87
MAAASTARHETGALLRAHLAAASRYGHATRTCPVCHRLQRLAMEADDPVAESADGAAEDGEGEDGTPLPQCDASH